MELQCKKNTVFLILVLSQSSRKKSELQCQAIQADETSDGDKDSQ